MHDASILLLPLQAVVKPPMAVTNAVSWRSEGIRSDFVAQHAAAAVGLRSFQPKLELGRQTTSLRLPWQRWAASAAGTTQPYCCLLVMVLMPQAQKERGVLGRGGECQPAGQQQRDPGAQ